MNLDHLILLVILLPVLVCIPYLILGIKRRPEARRQEQELLAEFRALAEAQYRSHQVASSDRRFRFDPDIVTVVDDQEFFSRSKDGKTWYFRVERILRNPSGEYFKMIYGTHSIERFSHIEHRIAKIVLKARYRAPEES